MGELRCRNQCSFDTWAVVVVLSVPTQRNLAGGCEVHCAALPRAVQAQWVTGARAGGNQPCCGQRKALLVFIPAACVYVGNPRGFPPSKVSSSGSKAPIEVFATGNHFEQFVVRLWCKNGPRCMEQGRTMKQNWSACAWKGTAQVEATFVGHRTTGE